MERATTIDPLDAPEGGAAAQQLSIPASLPVSPLGRVELERQRAARRQRVVAGRLAERAREAKALARLAAWDLADD